MKQKVIRKTTSILDMNGNRKPVLLRILPVLILFLLLILLYFAYREEQRMEEERYPVSSSVTAAVSDLDDTSDFL